MMAAAALAAIEYTIPRFPQVHTMAKNAGLRLQKTGYQLALPVQTNMVVLDLEASGIPGEAFVDACKQKDVAVFPNGRLVFHHQTNQDGVESLITALAELMDDKRNGAELLNGDVQGGCS